MYWKPDLTSITIPEGVTSIGEAAFYGCSGLTTITIPKSVTSIGELAFYGCSSLTSVNIPVGVTSIEHNTFGCCSNLTTITIPEGVKSIESQAFQSCISLRAVTIPESVTSIGEGAFYGCCNDLTSITLPKDVTAIGDHSFYGCSSLSSVIVGMLTPVDISMNSSTFGGISETAILYVPIGSKAVYQAADGWKEFKEIVETGTDISQLDNAIYIEPFTARIGNKEQMNICLKNAEAASAYVFDLMLPEGITVAKNSNGKYMDELSERHDDHTRTFNYKGENTYGLSTLSGNSEQLTGNDGPIRLVTIEASDNMVEGNYAIEIKNASYSKPDGTLVSLPDTRAVVTVEDYVLGDVNGNGGVDIGDAVSIVNYLVGKDSSNFVAKAADTNKNGQIDIGDAVTIVNLLVGKIPNFTREFNFILDEKEPE